MGHNEGWKQIRQNEKKKYKIVEVNDMGAHFGGIQ